MLGLAAASLFFAWKGAKTVWPYLASHKNAQKNGWHCSSFPFLCSEMRKECLALPLLLLRSSRCNNSLPWCCFPLPHLISPPCPVASTSNLQKVSWLADASVDSFRTVQKITCLGVASPCLTSICLASHSLASPRISLHTLALNFVALLRFMSTTSPTLPQLSSACLTLPRHCLASPCLDLPCFALPQLALLSLSGVPGIQ